MRPVAQQTGVQFHLLPSAGARDLVAEQIVERVDELALLIDQGNGNEYPTAVVRAHASLLEAILEQHPEQALESGALADFLAGELDRRNELETDILDIDVEIDVEAQEIAHGSELRHGRDLEPGHGLHM